MDAQVWKENKNNKEMTDNQLKLTGILYQDFCFSHEKHEKYYRSELLVCTGEEKAELIPVYIAERHLKKAFYKKGNTVDMEGCLRSHAYWERGKKHFSVIILLTRISQVSSDMIHRNLAFLKGKVSGCNKEEKSNEQKRHFLLEVKRDYGITDKIPCNLDRKLFSDRLWEGDLLYIYGHIIPVDGKPQFLKINAYQAQTG